jgi:hypothetical protein
MGQFFSSQDAFDLTGRSLDILAGAWKGFKEGQVLHEEPFLSHVLGAINGKICSFGHTTPGNSQLVSCRAYSTHQLAPDRSDLYGADLGVIVEQQQTGRSKLALIQIKMRRGDHGDVDPRQVQELANDPQVKGRGFVISVDRTRLSPRVQDADSLWQESRIQSDARSCKKSSPVSTAQWTRFASWLNQWLQCQVGRESIPGDAAEQALRAVARRFATVVESEQPQDIWEGAGLPPVKAILFVQTIPLQRS